MSWSFALVNNKLAEIYFENGKDNMPEMLGHCYVKEKEYPTKKEKKWILEDTKRYKFSYRKGCYRDTVRNIKLKIRHLKFEGMKKFTPR